jgi:starch synthase (maltosyl-transferring)
MPRSTRTQHESGPGAPSGATDAAPRDDLAPEHPVEEPGEGWSVLPRPHDRTAPPRIQILNPAPMIDCGRFPAKRTVGEWVEVSADVFRDGHEILRAQVRYRGPGDAEWSETPMRWIDRDVDGDRWAGAFEVDRVGRWEFTVEAWSDLFATWRDELRRKLESGQHDLRGELAEGAVLLEEALGRMQNGDSPPDSDRRLVEHVLVTLADPNAPEEAKHDAALGPELLAAVARPPAPHDSTCLERSLPLEVERVRARFGAWYELFPRSFGGFEGVRRRLPKLADLGFDVLYLPPIHPIGVTNRKGRNNSLQAKPGDPGSPWAIGGEEGGHDAIHPELGTVEEFERLVTEAREHGLEIALDFAIQCSADHPWLKEHPEWFNRRPDGTLKYAENPPKRYQDIYNVNWDSEDWRGLWDALRDVLMAWVERGVRVFRVDNPHTKPLPFWEWLIGGIHEEHPDVIFLSEAFTRPKMMQRLAKLGFSQSYTYFAWRNTKWELTQYLTELAQTEMANYFRPNFWPNTPDILTEYLQHGGRPAFKIRVVLAAMLSPAYGIYSGYELCEDRPLAPGSEEYHESEKYRFKPRDWNRADSLAPYIARLNHIRRNNPALHRLRNLWFHNIDNDQLLCFSKVAPGRTDPILVVVNLDPHNPHAAMTSLDMWQLGLEHVGPFEAHDLLTDARYVWNGPHNYVHLDPSEEPAHILRLRAL